MHPRLWLPQLKSPALIQAGCCLCLAVRRGIIRWLVVSKSWFGTWDCVFWFVDPFPGSTSESDTSASCPPRTENPASLPPLASVRMRDSSRSTDVSSSSRSRLESALTTSRLDWGCGKITEALPDDRAESSGGKLELAVALCLVRYLVLIGLLWGGGLGTEGRAFGTDLTGSSMFLCKVLSRPLPSSLRTLYTGMVEFGWAVTTQISSSHLSANLCLPCSLTCLTNTWSPGWRVAPRTFWSYHPLLASPAFLILASTKLLSILYALLKVSHILSVRVRLPSLLWWK